VRVLEAAQTDGLRFSFEEAEVGAELYRCTGEDLPAPWRYDVVVLENMFGDILSDLGAATVGGLGLAPSGDVGDHHALFQPCHGSAPDIAGRGVANPIAAILSAAMMCRWLGLQHDDPAATRAADRIEAAVARALADPRAHTYDIGGAASTRAAADAVLSAL